MSLSVIDHVHQYIHIHKGEVKYKNCITKDNNVYEPLNIPSIIDGLSDFLGIHDMILLSLLSKKIRTVVIKKFQIIVNKIKDESIIIDAIHHRCYKCYDKMKELSSDGFTKQLVAICKIGNKKFLKTFEKQYSLCNLNQVAGLLDECIIFSLNNHYFINKLTTDNTVENLNTLSLISQNLTEKTDVTIDIVDNLLKDPMTKEKYIILLQSMCFFEKTRSINSYNYLTLDNIDLIYQLIQGDYKSNIIDALLKIYINLINIIPNENLDVIINKLSLHTSSSKIYNIIRDIYPSLSTKHKLALLDKIYDYIYGNLGEMVNFLSETNEFNNISIDYATKYYKTNGIFTNKLTNMELIYYINTSINGSVIENCLSNLTDNDECQSLIYNKHISLTSAEKLLTFKNINENLKLELIDYVYHYKSKLDLLDYSREHNLLSLHLAEKYKGYIYAKHLTFDDLLISIKKYEHCHHVVKILTHQLKRHDIKNFIYTNYNTLYPCISINDDDVETTKYYQLVISDDLKDITWMLSNNLISYQELVVKIYKKICNHYDALINIKYMHFYINDVVIFIANHEQFHQIDVYIVLMLLKYYGSSENICKAILKHPFF
jgi:hypothetical protein